MTYKNVSRKTNRKTCSIYINIVPKIRFNSKPKVIYKLQKDHVLKKYNS